MDCEKIAYSRFFNSYIKCTRYVSDKKWFFKLCDAEGNTRGQELRAKTKFSFFDWNELLKNPFAPDGNGGLKIRPIGDGDLTITVGDLQADKITISPFAKTDRLTTEGIPGGFDAEWVKLDPSSITRGKMIFRVGKAEFDVLNSNEAELLQQAIDTLVKGRSEDRGGE